MSNSPNLDLPYLAPNQAQKHVTLNESLITIDAVAQLRLSSRDATTLPASPEEGECHAVSDSPDPVYAAFAGAIALWADGSWVRIAPRQGWLAYDLVTGEVLTFDGTSFVLLDVQYVSTLGVGAAPAAGNALTVSGDTSLFTHDAVGSDHRLGLNRSAETGVASLIFETAFQADFEVGCLSASDFSVKAFPSGGGSIDVLSIDRETGYVGLGASATERLRISNGFLRCGLHSISCFEVAGTAAMKIAFYGTGDRAAFCDYHACDDRSTQDARIIRKAGLNGQLVVETYGTGGVDVLARDNGPVTLSTANTNRLTVTSSGDIGIGTSSPSTRLQVSGPVRIGSVDAASLPSAGTVGEGSLIFVSSGTNAPYLAVSDGSTWIRLAEAV